MLQSFQKIASLSLSSPPTSLNCALSLFYKSFLFLPIGFFSCCRHQSVGAMLGMPPSKSVETATPPTQPPTQPSHRFLLDFLCISVFTPSLFTPSLFHLKYNVTVTWYLEWRRRGTIQDHCAAIHFQYHTLLRCTTGTVCDAMQVMHQG